VLTDFGIARSAGAAQLTAAGSVLGTASYISPEQAMGEQATPLSDVYALGVVAYQCLAGHRPFEGDNPLEIAMRHVREAPPPLPGDIPPSVRVIVERAMAKQPAARWPNAAAFGQVARRAAAELGATSPPVAVGTGSGAARANGPAPVATGVPAPGTRVLAPTNRGGAAGAVPAGYLRGQPVPGYLQTPVPQARRGMSTGTVVAIVVAVVLVAVCIGAGLAFLQRANKNQTQSLGVPSAVAGPPSSAGGTNSEGRFEQ